MLHDRLETHFRALADARDSASRRRPVFALEHGLGGAELALLRSEVLNTVQRAWLPRDAWLPFVVYAAEIGYDFSGDEYWQTFSAKTPGWAGLGDQARQYIRSRFMEFRDHFSGAEPSGPWAGRFTIICWPITHAVLPTDLQRHLARLLFDFRRSLTAEDLRDPEELGRRLAARAWHMSSRFEAFAQNTLLLGQVATALLTGGEDDSTYLLPSTLTRIVEDLSKERQSLRWLRNAKATAQSVRSRGFRASGRGERTDESDSKVYVASTDPSLFLREGREGWSLYLELPDLTALSERLPIIGDELAHLRPRINGVDKRFAGGHLLYPGQWIKANSWPRADTALIQLENGSDVVNELLADQCVISPGPRWLFRVRTPSLATEVRGKFVRADQEYVLVSQTPIEDDLPSWASAVESATNGAFAYRLLTPDRLDDTELEALAKLSIGAVMDVEVRPAAYVAATWDGEGTAEWLEGEEPLIAIRSSRAVARCIVNLDNTPTLVPWPEASNELVLGLRGLGRGAHVLEVALVPEGADEPVIEGSLDVNVRPPQTRPTTGTPREGLMILASPARPTLEELWNGQGFLELLGPAGSRAKVTMELTDRLGRRLAQQSTTLELRVDRARWSEMLARHFRRAEKLQRQYDRAEACEIAVTVSNIGSASIRCERSFTVLRWAFGRDGDGPFVVLVDNTSGSRIATTLYDFAAPGEAKATSVEAGQEVRWPDGGLIHATDGSVDAAVILPPRVRTLQDLQTRRTALPQLGRSPTEILRAIQLGRLWATASLPSDPFAATRRLSVLRTMAQAVASTVGGQRWASAERTCEARGAPEISLLAEAVGDKADHRRLANATRLALQTLQDLGMRHRITRFAGLLRDHLDDVLPTPELSEFLLRLATEPWTLLDRSESDFDDHLVWILGSPVLLRAARFIVLATAPAFDDEDLVYPGWQWE